MTTYCFAVETRYAASLQTESFKHDIAAYIFSGIRVLEIIVRTSIFPHFVVVHYKLQDKSITHKVQLGGVFGTGRRSERLRTGIRNLTLFRGYSISESIVNVDLDLIVTAAIRAEIRRCAGNEQDMFPLTIGIAR